MAGSPTVSVNVIAYNEAANIRGTIENLLDLDYPEDLLQILVVSDASTDGTDEIIQSYAARGVEYLRVPTRGGKTAAENLALPHLRGEIILSTDAAVRVERSAARKLIGHFQDPSVGIVSGSDVSVASAEDESNWGESLYVRYEMLVRDLETRSGGIIGASGCLFAIRRDLHDVEVATDSFRDFAAPLIVRELGYRTSSEPEALCFVPRTPALGAEYRRKVRTTLRGLSTVLRGRRLLNPFRFGSFAWKLFSHKLCRWIAPLTAVPAALVLLLGPSAELRTALIVALVGFAISVLLANRWPEGRSVPRAIAFIAAAGLANIAVVHATARLVIGDKSPIWEPTRRSTWAPAKN